MDINRRFTCPFHGEFGEEGIIEFNLPKAQGVFCLQCLQDWLKRNFPDLKEQKPKELKDDQGSEDNL